MANYIKAVSIVMRLVFFSKITPAAEGICKPGNRSDVILSLGRICGVARNAGGAASSTYREGGMAHITVGVEASQRRSMRGLSNRLTAAQMKDWFDCIEVDKNDLGLNI